MSAELDPLEDEEAGGEDERGGHRLRLFDGDSSGLTLQQRACLIKLIKQPFLSAAEDPEEWDTLIEARHLIRGRLHDLLLDLRLDTISKVAYKLRAPLGDEVIAPSLLRNTRWTAHQTALLVVLRERLRVRTALTDAVYVELDELVAAMTTMLPPSVDETRPRQITERAVEALSKLGLVKQSTAEGERYRINPALESLLPVAKLRQLLDTLRTANAESNADGAPFAATQEAPADGGDLDERSTNSGAHPEAGTAPNAAGAVAPSGQA